MPEWKCPEGIGGGVRAGNADLEAMGMEEVGHS